MTWLLKKMFLYPARGWNYAIKNEFSIKAELVIGPLVILALQYLAGPLTAVELLLMVFCVLFILITELQNSAIEAALDRLHPEQHEDIGKSKDLASAAVNGAYIFAIISLVAVLSGAL